MRFPAYTGQVAQFLDVTEPRLNEAIRRQRINPPPPVVSGRRSWNREHVIQAATALGVLTDELRERLSRQEVDHVS